MGISCDDKIALVLDGCLCHTLKGNAVKLENAEEVDVLVQEKFNSTIVDFIRTSSVPIVVVRK